MITARAMREAAPQRGPSDDHLRALVAGITDYAIVMLDPNGCVASWNAGAQQVLGYHEEEVIGVPFAKFYLPEDVMHGRPAEVLRIVKATGRHEEEGWQLRKDGSRFRNHSILTTLEEPAGALLGFSMVSEDVTARWETNESLQISEGRFRALLTSVPHYAQVMLDDRGRVVSWSAEAERLSGYASAEILSLPSSVFYTAHDLGSNKPYQDLTLARVHGRYEFEDWRVRKGGARVWTHVIITALLDPSGTLLGFSEVTRDISARKQTMDALERRAEEFQQANTALEQSIWVAVHDLQAPLHLIASSTALLAAQYGGRLNADADALIRCAVDEARQMQQVIHELLASTDVACRSGSRANGRADVVGGETLPRESFCGHAIEVIPNGSAIARERI